MSIVIYSLWWPLNRPFRHLFSSKSLRSPIFPLPLLLHSKKKIKSITNPFIFKVDPISLASALFIRRSLELDNIVLKRKEGSWPVKAAVLQQGAKGWRASTKGCRSCWPMTLRCTYQSKSACDDFDTSGNSSSTEWVKFVIIPRLVYKCHWLF